MRLHDVANRFNRMVCFDAYSGDEVFQGQLGLYDDNKRDSETAGRRVLSLAPGLTIPPRRVIEAAGTRFILGHANPDDYMGSTIRVGYVAQEAPYSATVRTLAQVCEGQSGLQAWAGQAWVKDLSYTEQTSREYPEYHAHFSVTEAVARGNVVSMRGRNYLVRSTNFGGGGTLVVSCEEMAEPSIEDGTILIGHYDPVQGSRTGSPVPATFVRLRWQSLFTYLNAQAPKFEPGDIQVAVSETFSVKSGAVLTMSDGDWTVKSMVKEGAVWLCRATRGG